jgi:hypothetical protein
VTYQWMNERGMGATGSPKKQVFLCTDPNSMVQVSDATSIANSYSSPPAAGWGCLTFPGILDKCFLFNCKILVPIAFLVIWSLNSGPHTYYTSTLPLEPCLQLSNCILNSKLEPGSAAKKSSKKYSLHECCLISNPSF